jgi:hypothetical protein
MGSPTEKSGTWMGRMGEMIERLQIRRLTSDAERGMATSVFVSP